MADENETISRVARGRTLLEQRAQSVLLAVITAALIYSGSFVLQAREDSVRTAAQLASLTNEVAALRVTLTGMQSDYTSRDDYRDHEVRIRQLESRR